MGDIHSRAWVAKRLRAGATVTDLAAEAGVSRQTVYTWLDRHQLVAAPKAKPRPSHEELLALYAQLGSAAAVAEHLSIGRDTARRWLVAAGANFRRGGRPSIELDASALRKRRGEGATLAELAVEFAVAPETVRRKLESDEPLQRTRPAAKGEVDIR